MEEERKRRVESLGWLTESAILPKRHKAIEGVGPSSILELKAQLYQTQEEAKKNKDLAPDVEFHRAKKKVSSDIFTQKNSGVEARARRLVFLFEISFLFTQYSVYYGYSTYLVLST